MDRLGSRMALRLKPNKIQRARACDSRWRDGQIGGNPREISIWVRYQRDKVRQVNRCLLGIKEMAYLDRSQPAVGNKMGTQRCEAVFGNRKAADQDVNVSHSMIPNCHLIEARPCLPVAGFQQQCL